MTEEILPNLYTIEVPLPGNPLKATNSYVIKGDTRTLIIDTGMNREECISALSTGLKELDVDLNRADLFITHLHADHSGLVSTLATDSSTIYLGEADAPVVTGKLSSSWGEMPRIAIEHGFPQEEMEKALGSHPGRKYSSQGALEVTVVKDGDKITIGDYAFECIETPGHTRGHMCLYEPNKKLFVAGDHVLIDITPNISLWSPDETDNPLRDYLASLEKVRGLDVSLVLPGHRSRFDYHRQRIDELLTHHRIRANEVLSILEQGPQHT
ncbi:MAG: MBL fold metallo-hydrolase, partial [Chloroflexota bacterium]